MLRFSRKRILKLKVLSNLFELGEEVFDCHTNAPRSRFSMFKHFYGVPRMIGDQWSTIFPKNVFFVFEHQFGLHRSPRKLFCAEPQDMFISYTQLTGFVKIWPTGCSKGFDLSQILNFPSKFQEFFDISKAL